MVANPKMKVHIADIRSIIQLKVSNPKTKWDNRPIDRDGSKSVRSFKNTKFAEVYIYIFFFFLLYMFVCSSIYLYSIQNVNVIYFLLCQDPQGWISLKYVMVDDCCFHVGMAVTTAVNGIHS